MKIQRTAEASSRHIMYSKTELNHWHRLCRWNAPGRAQVLHPLHGTVIVPCSSPYSALLNAAEIWRCSWLDIRDAEVRAARPGEVPAAMPQVSPDFAGIIKKKGAEKVVDLRVGTDPCAQEGL